MIYNDALKVGTVHSQPILASLGTGTLSVAMLVVVGIGGVDIWVALRFSISLIYHSYSVRTPVQVLK